MSKGRGLSGLANVGNTCYLNSCIQALSHTPELSRVIKKCMTDPSRLTRCVESVAVIEWGKLRALLWKEDCTIAPHGFVGALKHVSDVKKLDLAIGRDQNDAQEFLQFLVECFHVALSREVDMKIEGVPQNDQDRLAQTCYKAMCDMYQKEYSEMLPMFYGVHVSVVEGMDGHQYSIRPEPFSVLSLPIPYGGTSHTLGSCLDAYCEACELTGENQYETAEGFYVDARKSLCFWSLPKILVVHIKRWCPTGHKDQRLVDAPSTLNMSKYVRGYKAESFVYDLYAVCNHSGVSMGGHYTASVKPYGQHEWYEFNDTRVSRFSNRSAVVTPYAYCLFYRKK